MVDKLILNIYIILLLHSYYIICGSPTDFNVDPSPSPPSLPEVRLANVVVHRHGRRLRLLAHDSDHRQGEILGERGLTEYLQLKP